MRATAACGLEVEPGAEAVVVGSGALAGDIGCCMDEATARVVAELAINGEVGRGGEEVSGIEVFFVSSSLMEQSDTSKVDSLLSEATVTFVGEGVCNVCSAKNAGNFDAGSALKTSFGMLTT